ncbi:MAG: ABC transporter ATP-binding protein [Candidatus Levybacteria bacterium RIFCSPLOWO2_01_FULL_42_15]|nr:MAG: ABC transporter ATP-binding protein [Candidatus Levybacteria bacterium RIFCSPLOWO2_01_FULL_42_15]
MEKILSVKNLSKTFNGVRAVNNISFSVAKGEIVGLLGPNGAGKTTTIQMILGLIKPTRGTITVFGKNLETHRMEILSEVNFSSAYISLPGNLKVWENLYTFARLYGVKNYKKRVEELARFFEITPLLSKLYVRLSSGQATRVNLAKALLNSPKLLFLDEPTSSLDPDIADRVRKLLKKIQKEQALTILYTTHNMIEVEELCDRAIFIHQGKIVTEGTPKQLIKRFGLKDLNEVFIKIARKS